MANIPLSEIPGAPQAPFAPTADASMVSRPADVAGQVGNQAKSDIAQGYDASKVNPAQMGEVGRALIGLGGAVTQGGDGVGSLINDIGLKKQRDDFYTAGITGTPKAYANQDAVISTYHKLIDGQPTSMYPTFWQQAAGKDGENFHTGMSGLEVAATIHETTRMNAEGYHGAGNIAYQNNVEQQAADAQITINGRINKQDWTAASTLVDAGLKNGTLSKNQYVSYTDSINTGKEIAGYMGAVQQDFNNFFAGKSGTIQGPNIQAIQKATDQGTGIGNLSPETTKKLSVLANAQANQQLWNATNVYYQQIQAGTLKDSGQLDNDKSFQRLPDEQKNTIYGAINKSLQGQPVGEANRLAAQQALNNFPPTDGSDVSKAVLSIQNQIIKTVPDSFCSDMLKALDAKKKELIENGGNLKPQSGVQQYTSKAITDILEKGTLGKYNPDATGSEVQQNLGALNTASSILKSVLSKNPQNEFDAQKLLDQATRQIRAGSPAATPGVWDKAWNYLGNFGSKPQAANSAGWQSGKATIFGTMPEDGKISPDMKLVADKNDPVAGQNPQTHNPDKSVQLASVNMDTLRKMGIDPKDAPKKYDVLVSHAGKTYRFPIGDNGPKDPANVDFTPGAHLAMGTQSGSKVIYKVVPRNA